jgi:phosphatidylinositol phospholipase C delta
MNNICSHVCNSGPPPSDRKRTAESKAYNAYLKAQLLLPASSSVFHSSSILRAVQTSHEVEYTSGAQRVQPLTGDLNFAYPATNTGPIDELWNNLPWRNKEREKSSINAEFEWEIWEKWEELTFLRRVDIQLKREAGRCTMR